MKSRTSTKKPTSTPPNMAPRIGQKTAHRRQGDGLAGQHLSSVGPDVSAENQSPAYHLGEYRIMDPERAEDPNWLHNKLARRKPAGGSENPGEKPDSVVGNFLQRQSDSEEKSDEETAAAKLIQREETPEEKPDEETAAGKLIQRKETPEEKPDEETAAGKLIQREETPEEKPDEETAAGKLIQREEESGENSDEEISEKPAGLQTKLKVGAPNDAYEQEADKKADEVMRMPDSSVQRICDSCEQEQQEKGELQRQEESEEKPDEETAAGKLIQRQGEPEEQPDEETASGKLIQRQEAPEEKPNEETAAGKLIQREEQPENKEEEVNASPFLLRAKSRQNGPRPVNEIAAGNIQTLRRGGGRPLSGSERAFFEPRFQRDFGRVRLHTDENAARAAGSVNARAFTLGRDVFFNKGEYNPGTEDGKKLMAHELTHTVQQGQTIRKKFELQAKRTDPHIPWHPVGKSRTSGEVSTGIDISRLEAKVQRKMEPDSQTDDEAKTREPEEEEKKSREGLADENRAEVRNQESESGNQDPDQQEDASATKSPEENSAEESRNEKQQTGALEVAADTGSHPEPENAPRDQNQGTNPNEARGVAENLAPNEGDRSTVSAGEVASDAGGIKESEARKESTKVSSESPAGILSDLKGVLPSQALAGYDEALKNSKTALESQASQVENSLPVTQTPTGLQSGPARQSLKIPGEKQKSPSNFKSQKSGGSTASLNTQVQIPNTKNVPTSPGLPPKVGLRGEADPGQIAGMQSEAGSMVSQEKTRAKSLSQRDYGENRLAPAPDSSVIRAKNALSSPRLPEYRGETKSDLPAEVIPDVNRTMGPELAARIGEKEGEYKTKEAEQTQKISEAHAKAEEDRTREERTTTEKQQAEKKKAHEEVRSHKESWQKENEKIDAEFRNKSEGAGREQKEKIQTEKDKGERETQKHYRDAEKKAEQEKGKATAEERKKEEEARKESGGIVGWIKKAASAVVEGFRKAINFIYDNLRKAVKWIFEQAKKLAKAAIDLAVKAITGIIKAYAAILKGFISIALAAFPETAKKFNSLIDGVVSQAEEYINKAAEVLKTVVSVILDFLASTINSLLGLIQDIYNGILAVVGMLIRGEFAKIFKGVANLIAAAKAMPTHFEAAAYEQLIGADVSEPFSPNEIQAALDRHIEVPGHEARAAATERTAPVSGMETAEAGIGGIGAGPEERFPPPPYTPENIQVDPVVSDEVLNPELQQEILQQTGDGGSYTFAEAGPEGRTVDALRSESGYANEAGRISAEMSGTTGEFARTPEKAQYTDGLTPLQRAKIKWEMMKQDLSEWFSNHWPVILVAAIAVIGGLIAATILSGGAVLAALGALLEALAPIFLGLTIMQFATYFRDYLTKGWNGDTEGGAKALASGLAAAAIELITELITFGVGKALKGAKSIGKGIAEGARKTGGLAGKAVRSTGRVVSRTTRAVGRGVTRVAGMVIQGGKLLFQGVKKGFTKAFKRLGKLGEALLERFRFRKLRIRREGRWFFIEGYINPWVLLASGKIGKIENPNPRDPLKGRKPRLRKGDRLAVNGEDAVVISPRNARKLKYRPFSMRQEEYVKKILTGDSSLLASRMGTPSGEQAHHLIASSVAKSHPAAEEAALHGWDLNHPSNGMNIPDAPGRFKTPDGRGIWHHGGHTDEYYRAVEKELQSLWVKFNRSGKPSDFDWIGEMNKVSKTIENHIRSGKIRLYID